MILRTLGTRATNSKTVTMELINVDTDIESIEIWATMKMNMIVCGLWDFLNVIFEIGKIPLNFIMKKNLKNVIDLIKDSVLRGILPKIEEGLAKINKRGLPIVPHFQLLVALRYYASASFQVTFKIRYPIFTIWNIVIKLLRNLHTVVGDTVQVSQATISRIVFRVSCLLASLMCEYIKFPRNPRAREENHRLFCDLGKEMVQLVYPALMGPSIVHIFD